MAISKIFNSSFTKRLIGKVDDAIDSGIKNLRKNANFKALDKGTQNRIVNMKIPGRVQSEVVEGLENGASSFKDKFGTKLVQNADGNYEDLGFRIGKQRESAASSRISKQSSKKIEEVDDLADEIANMREKRVREGLASNGGVSITDETIAQRKQELNNIRNKEKKVYDKEGLQEKLKRRQDFKNNIENGTVGMPQRKGQVSGSQTNKNTTNKNTTNKNTDKKGIGNNFVYRAAAAGVGGGIVLSMANNRGQQSNAQLYGQGGY